MKTKFPQIPCCQLELNFVYVAEGRGQPTRGGPPAWELDEVLTTPLRKKKMLRITHKVRCFLWRQNNPEVNYSPTRISKGECF